MIAQTQCTRTRQECNHSVYTSHFQIRITFDVGMDKRSTDSTQDCTCGTKSQEYCDTTVSVGLR